MNDIKRIEGYDNYFVSKDGIVYSNKNGELKPLKPWYKQGYAIVSLSNKSVVKKESVHRLVAKAFVPNPHNLLSVDHINGNRKDNRIENLQWMSLEDNTTKELKDIGKHKFSEDEIIWIRNHYKKGDRTYGAKPLARLFNIDNHCIRYIVKGIYYKWVDEGVV